VKPPAAPPGCQLVVCKCSSNVSCVFVLSAFQQRKQNFAHWLSGVEHHLESEFRLFQRRRDVVGRNAEARLGNVRFLGELVKFRLIPFGAVLSRLKVRLGPCNAIYAS
jgi:hypothetical protein